MLSTLVATLVFAGAGQAAPIRLGPELPVEPISRRIGCSSDCTVIDANSGPAEGIVSPVDGVVLSWQVNRAQSGLPYALRVVTPGAPRVYTLTATSAPGVPLGEGVESFATDLPIEAGQTIGLDEPAAGYIGSAERGSEFAWEPSLVEGLASGPGSQNPYFVEMNATVLPGPTVTAVSPPTGPAAGGTTVTIEGADLEDVEAVTFGSVPARYTVDSETRITAISPAGPAATAPVTVTTAAGSATAPVGFVYEGRADGGQAPPTPPDRPAPSNPPLSIGRPSVDRAKGTATLPVTVPGAGILSVRATGIARPTHLKAAGIGVAGPGVVSLPISTTRAGLGPLRRQGKIRVVPLVTFTPTGGAPTALYRPVVLRLGGA